MDDNVGSTRFILVRHGESVGNRDRKFTTSHLSPLTELGREQALSAARWIAERFKPNLVVVSPYLRTRQTGAIIAEQLGCTIEVEEDLRERHMGILAGQPYPNITSDPTFDRNRFWLWRPAGGENFEEVRLRAGAVLDRLAGVHHGRELVVVSHGGVMTALWAHASGSWGRARVPRNCGVIVAEHAGGRYRTPLAHE
ncbi:MAG TPA: histidine phosphatase family protein [Candidatus Binataceae bacterium]|nr:histidine phosphatase family protein [Candidatus Binataceae bacterium]